MAQRRMFSLKVIDTDSFLDMSPTAQLLYFHLAMRADDDGFVSSPKKIMKMANTPDDDMRVLIAKRYIIPFESGICVIKDWKIHNYIQSDRYQETRYLFEKNQIKEGENGEYVERIQNVSKMDTQVRLEIGKDRLGKDNTGAKAQIKSKLSPLVAEVIKLFEEVDPKNKTYYDNKTQRKACDFLISEYTFDTVKSVIAVLPQTNKISYFPSVTTPYELKEKWVKLKDAIQKKKGEKINKGRGIANF